MILRLSTFLAMAAGLGLPLPTSAQEPQLQRDRMDPNNSRLLLHRKKKAQEMEQPRQRKLQQTLCNSIVAIDKISEDETGGEGPDEEFLCELDYGVTLPIQGTEEQIGQMRGMLHNGTLISYESTMEVFREVPLVDAAYEDADPIASLLQGGLVSLPSGDVNIIKPSNGGRRLNAGWKVQYEGQSPVLAVKITDKDGLAVAEDAHVISDKIFGTYGDQITAASCFKDCSFGKFQLTNQYSVNIDSKLSAPGVIEVNIPISLKTSSQTNIRAYAQKAVEDKLGFSLPGVMYITEDCYGTDCGWAAYAFIKGPFSMFISDNYMKPGVVNHEFGHNLGFAHSGGTDRRTYTDHTALMGNPLWGDDKGKMCFNAAKNFQLAVGEGVWYNHGPGTIMTWDSGTSGNKVLDTELVGIAEFNKITEGNPVVIKLETGTQTDYFLSFNRATGPTAQNVQASDNVVIHEAGNDGLSYAYSYLTSYLVTGQSYTFSKWRGTNQDLTIKVLNINTSVVPGIARVKIVYGNEPTNNPTSLPTNQPTPPAPTTPQPTPTTPQPTPTTQPTTTQPTTPTVITTNSCGDGVCASGKESPKTCSNDCTSKSFNAKNGNSNGNTNGLMFTIEAKETVTVNTLEIEGKKTGSSQVVVYTRHGDYIGHEYIASDWSVVFNQEVSLSKNIATSIGDFNTEVLILGGETVSFFVTSSTGMMVSTTASSAARAAENDSIVLHDGLSHKKPFQKVDKNARLNTSLGYYTSSKTRSSLSSSSTTTTEVGGEDKKVGPPHLGAEEETAEQLLLGEAEKVGRPKRDRVADGESPITATAVKHHHHLAN